MDDPQVMVRVLCDLTMRPVLVSPTQLSGTRVLIPLQNELPGIKMSTYVHQFGTLLTVTLYKYRKNTANGTRAVLSKEIAFKS